MTELEQYGYSEGFMDATRDEPLMFQMIMNVESNPKARDEILLASLAA